MTTNHSYGCDGRPHKDIRVRIQGRVDGESQCEPGAVRDAYRAAEMAANAREAVEGGILWARFAAMQYGTRNGMTAGEEASNTLHSIDALKEAAFERLRISEDSLHKLPQPNESLANEIKDIRKMLKAGISDSETRMVLTAMATGPGAVTRWYRCVNGHHFGVGACEMPMELALRNQCGERIGGQDHTPAVGVTAADDVQQQFRRLALDH